MFIKLEKFKIIDGHFIKGGNAYENYDGDGQDDTPADIHHEQ